MFERLKQNPETAQPETNSEAEEFPAFDPEAAKRLREEAKNPQASHEESNETQEKQLSPEDFKKFENLQEKIEQMGVSETIAKNPFFSKYLYQISSSLGLENAQRVHIPENSTEDDHKFRLETRGKQYEYGAGHDCGFIEIEVGEEGDLTIREAHTDRKHVDIAFTPEHRTTWAQEDENNGKIVKIVPNTSGGINIQEISSYESSYSYGDQISRGGGVPEGSYTASATKDERFFGADGRETSRTTTYYETFVNKEHNNLVAHLGGRAQQTAEHASLNFLTRLDDIAFRERELTEHCVRNEDDKTMTFTISGKGIKDGKQTITDLYIYDEYGNAELNRGVLPSEILERNS